MKHIVLTHRLHEHCRQFRRQRARRRLAAQVLLPEETGTPLTLMWKVDAEKQLELAYIFRDFNGDNY